MNDAREKRRLPVIGAPTAAATRPAWQWAVLGGLIALVGWAGLAQLVLSRKQRALEALVGRPVGDPDFARALQTVDRDAWLHFVATWTAIDLLTLTAAVTLGAWIVTRFGEPKRVRTTGVLVGVGATSLIVLVTAWQSGLAPTLLIAIVFGAGAGWLGAALSGLGRKL